MTANILNEGVWFLYDGECPVCEKAASALRIKETLGDLHLIDARTDKNHPLYHIATEQKLDLDEGMVIYHKSRLYHGQDALNFMAIYGAPKGAFNHINRLLFRSALLSRLLYPIMRACRNSLLVLRRKSKIRNLDVDSDPIFKPVFGDTWDAMPPIMHYHYANRPFMDDSYVVSGKMSVWVAPFLKLFSPFMRLIGSVPLKPCQDIPVTVEFRSDPTSRALHFIRTFHYEHGKPYIFHSRMMPLGSNKVAERMRYGPCWRVSFLWQEDRVILNHDGYGFWVFGKALPLPLNWLLGRVHAEEWETSPNSFAMFVEVHHPFFGKLYDYRGEFAKEASHA